MTNAATQTRSVVVEEDLPFPPQKVWRALTEPHLIEEWLMKSDFKPEAGHQFNFRADWGAVDCEVRTIEPEKRLAYSWDAYGLKSIVTWILTPTSTGTRPRMEQAGFGPGQEQFCQGAEAGWPNFFANLREALARAD